jgi:hemoglobin
VTTQQPMLSTVSDYERLGGDPVAETVGNRLCDLLLSDRPLAAYFEGMDRTRLEQHQRLLVAHALGRPAGDDRRDLRRAHAWLPLHREHFDQVAGHLAQALRDTGADAGVVSRVRESLAAVSDDVVSTVGVSGAAKWTPLP